MLWQAGSRLCLGPAADGSRGSGRGKPFCDATVRITKPSGRSTLRRPLMAAHQIGAVISDRGNGSHPSCCPRSTARQFAGLTLWGLRGRRGFGKEDARTQGVRVWCPWKFKERCLHSVIWLGLLISPCMRYLPRSVTTTSYFFPLEAELEIIEEPTAQKYSCMSLYRQFWEGWEISCMSAHGRHEWVTESSPQGRGSKRVLLCKSERFPLPSVVVAEVAHCLWWWW